jgi:hypothetical protein
LSIGGSRETRDSSLWQREVGRDFMMLLFRRIRITREENTGRKSKSGLDTFFMNY